jgi:hypothetical protein
MANAIKVFRRSLSSYESITARHSELVPFVS